MIPMYKSYVSLFRTKRTPTAGKHSQANKRTQKQLKRIIMRHLQWLWIPPPPYHRALNRLPGSFPEPFSFPTTNNGFGWCWPTVPKEQTSWEADICHLAWKELHTHVTRTHNIGFKAETRAPRLEFYNCSLLNSKKVFITFHYRTDCHGWIHQFRQSTRDLGWKTWFHPCFNRIFCRSGKYMAFSIFMLQEWRR